MLNVLLLPEWRELLADRDAKTLAEVLTEMHPASVAEITEGLTVEETWQLLDYAPIDRQAEIFSFYPSGKQDEMVSGVGRDRMSKLIEVMSPDDRVDLLKRLAADVVDSLMPLVAKAERQDIRMLLSYPEGSAGSVMTTEYATVPADMTVEKAIASLRQQAPSRETIYYVYVVDDQRRLIGFLSLRDLILAKPLSLVSDIMERDIVTVQVDQDQEEAALKLARYDFLAIPVVDEQRQLVGIITHDDVLDVVVEEATEDALHMGGVTPMEENYLDAAFRSVWWRRAAWLHLPAAAWGALVEAAGWICPLTPLENRLRLLAGQETYATDFIDHYLMPVLYPAALTREGQMVLGLAVLVVNGAVYAWVWRRWKRAPSGA
ncbi:MAG TPA: magnesium transporter [Candidatus Anammoximicrobium sp.]|nr:magnesium transporter [Candidatus Anammoximicrobium sp.]